MPGIVLPSPAKAIDTLYWPKHPCGFAGAARNSPNAWMVDLLRHGVAISDHVEFTIESVLARFTLCIRLDESFSTDPPCLPTWDDVTFHTDEGDSAECIGGLVTACLMKYPWWMYPLEYDCRIVRAREAERYILTDFGLQRMRIGRGGKFEHRLDG